MARGSHGQRSLVGYSPRNLKESDTTEHIQTATARGNSLLNTPFTPDINHKLGSGERIGFQNQSQFQQFSRRT